jgi:hypothetical protein
MYGVRAHVLAAYKVPDSLGTHKEHDRKMVQQSEYTDMIPTIHYIFGYTVLYHNVW